MIKEKLILFDIDSTLFDTQKYILTFMRKIGEELIAEDIEDFVKIALAIYEENKNNRLFFDLEGFSSVLSKKINRKIDNAKIRKIVFDEKLLEECIYPETLSVFKNLSNNKNLIFGIFSSGKTDFQLLKIKSIRDFIHEKHIHISIADKKSQVAKVLEKYNDNIKIYLIDDLLEILMTAKIFNPSITVIWSKRGRHMYDQKIDGFTPDFTVTSLTEIIKIVDQ